MATLIVQDKTGAKHVEISPLPFSIGKKTEANELVLARGNVSRQHCIIRKENGCYFIQDKQSRNGTFLNGKRVQGEAPLADRAVISISGHTMTFLDDAATPAAATPGKAVAESTPPPASADRRVTPVALKRKVHEEVLATLDLKHNDFSEKSEDEIRQKTTDAARAAVRKFAADRPAWLREDALVKEIADEAIGLGPLEDLLADREVDEIMVNGWDKIYVERHGRIELTNKQFTGDEQVLAVIRRILAPIGRRVDESSPMVDARLPDGSRVNAIIAPICLTGPTITIRKFAATPYTDEDLIKFGSISKQMMDFLRFAVHHRQNICISGGTGSGKTTLLNVVSDFIPETERIVTIEDAAELQLHQDHIVSLEAKPPTLEGRGAIPIRKLVINALRMRPDRIVIGECRGGEALDMLQAMNTGHDGSLTTLHANSPRDSLSRLETMVLMAGVELPVRAIREQMASAINLIVHGARMSDGARRTTQIAEITGMEGDIITMQNLYEFRQEGYGKDGKVKGAYVSTGAVPKFAHTLRERGIEVDMTFFQEQE